VAKGVDIEMAPLDEDHVRSKITWSEQDVGGGKLVVEVTVKNTMARPKSDDRLRSDARRLPCVSHEPLPIQLRISAARPGYCCILALVESRKIAKEKAKIAMLCEGSYDPLKDAVERR
jgi:hypothetical protein